MGFDDELAVGLVPVAGDLGNELVGGDAGGERDAHTLAHALPDLAGDERGAAVAGRGGADIEIGFVQRQWLDEFGVVAEDAVHRRRGFAVLVHARVDHDQLRALAQRGGHGHGGVHAVAAGFVVAGGDDAALLRTSADSHGLAEQSGVVAGLDGGVETVAVAVDDLAGRLKREGVRVTCHGKCL